MMLTGCGSNIKDGVSYLEDGKYVMAMDAFADEIAEEKHFEEAYRGMGIAAFELGEYDKAVDALKEALVQGTKESAAIYSMLGASYYELEQYEDALEAYEKALAQEDCIEELKQEIALHQITAYERLGEWEKAKDEMKAYQDAYPEDASVEKEAEFLETR